MLFSKQRQINALIPDNADKGLQDGIRVIRNGKVEDIHVRVNITHKYTGDISISLESPSGTVATLLKQTRKPGKNLSAVFDGKSMEKFRGEKIKGEWKLTVKDGSPLDQGYLNNWTIGFKSAHKDTELFITDGKGGALESHHYCHQKGKVKSIKGSLDLLHPSIDKLKVELISPKGKSVTLFSKSDPKKNLKKSFPKDILKKLEGEEAKGAWCLKVTDKSKSKSARMKRWSLDLGIS